MSVCGGRGTTSQGPFSTGIDGSPQACASNALPTQPSYWPLCFLLLGTSFVCFAFGDRVSFCSPHWLETPYLDYADLLPLAPKFWDYRCALATPCPTCYWSLSLYCPAVRKLDPNLHSTLCAYFLGLPLALPSRNQRSLFSCPSLGAFIQFFFQIMCSGLTGSPVLETCKVNTPSTLHLHK